LVNKLRETRAFAGFTRLKPYDGEKTLREIILNINGSLNSVPADIIRGEGIFIEFKESEINKWAKSIEINRRYTLMRNNMYRIFVENYLGGRLTSKFIMIHTFAHQLINELSRYCGYGSSALKERIYSSSDSNETMNGVLIYTASSSSDGTLGGLIQQGKPGNLEKIVTNALEKARWCSSDPVCMDIGPQGPFGANMAACHNCAILPETSCENFNQLLDRAFIIGSNNDPSIGYFSKLF
jgi:hypothetical protein